LFNIAFFHKKIWNFQLKAVYLHKISYTYMTRRLLILSLAGLLTVAIPAITSASEMEFAAVEQIGTSVTISVSGQTVLVAGAQGETLEVVSLTGRQVMTVKIESPAQRVELNVPRGCYILKVGKVVRKIQVR
jgi:hypothetical protein